MAIIKDLERELRIAQSELDRFEGSVFVEPVRLAEHRARVLAAEVALQAVDNDLRPTPVKATAEQQLGFLARDVYPALRAIVEGYDYNPGSSDLDDERPINVRMTLADYRRATRLQYELRKAM